MQIKICGLIFFLIYINSFLLGSEVAIEEYPKSWKSAKKLSKKSGKLILIDFYFVGCAPCKKLDEQVFKVDSIRLKLEEKYVIYKYNINKESRSLVDKFKVISFPSIIVTNHKEEKLIHITGFTSADKFMDRLVVAHSNKPISYYQKKYKKNKDNLQFLIEYVDLLLGGNVKGEEVYGQYYHLEKDNNCRKLNAFVSSKLMNDESELKVFLDNYNNFKFLECKNLDHINIVYNAATALIYKQEKSLDLVRVLDQTSKLLELTSEIKDSLGVTKRVALYTHRDNKLEYPTAYRKALLDAYRYRRENYIYIDSIYTELLSLSVYLKKASDLRQLMNVLNQRPKFASNPDFVELVAIIHFRLGNENEAIESIVLANDLGVKQKQRFKPLLPSLKKKGLLIPVKE